MSEQQIAPNRPTAHKFKPTNTEATSPFGFFLLCVYTALVFIRPHEWPFLEIEFPILRTILITTFVAYIAFLRPKVWDIQCTILVLLFFSMMLSEFRAGRFLSDMTPVIDWVNSNIIPFILFVGFLVSLKRQRIIMIISLVACLVMIHQAWSQLADPLGQGWAEAAVYRYDSADELQQVRYIGIFNDPNDMGMFLIMNLPFAAYFFVTGKGGFSKLISASVFVLLLVGVYWTGSRGSMIGAFAVFFAFFYIKFGKIVSVLLGILAIPAGFIAMMSFRSIDAKDASAMDRLTAWYEGIQMVKYRPLFGFGKNRFLEYHSKVAHNSFVTIMSELGVIGYTLWMAFFIFIFYMLFRIRRMPDIPGEAGQSLRQEKTLSLYMAVSMLGFAVTAFFISRSYAMFFYIFAAVVSASFYRLRHKYPELPLAFTRKDITRVIGLSLLNLILLYLLLKSLLSYFY